MASSFVDALNSSTDNGSSGRARRCEKFTGAGPGFGEAPEFTERFDAEPGWTTTSCGPRIMRETGAKSRMVSYGALRIRGIGNETVEYRQQGVAIRRGLGHGISAGYAASAGAVVG